MLGANTNSFRERYSNLPKYITMQDVKGMSLVEMRISSLKSNYNSYCSLVLDINVSSSPVKNSANLNY